jgi:hypothetical protein
MANTVTVGGTTYRLKFPAVDGNGLNFIYNAISPDDLETEYHFTDFNYQVEVERENLMGLPGTWAGVEARISVSSFTVSYSPQTFAGGTPSSSAVIWVTGNTTLTTATLTLAGQHQGVFEKNQWHVRNNEFDFSRQYNNVDARDEFRNDYEVSPAFITIERSRAAIREKLSNGYYAGFKFTPDRTLSTSITWTIRLALTGGGANTSLTFSNITQTVRNDWSKYLREIREFVYEGKEEGLGVTKYNQGGDEVQLSNPVFTVTNRSTPGSGALITVTTAQEHLLFTGNQVQVTITSTATNHALAAGTFNVVEIPSATSLVYECTSTGTINTTSSLLGSIKGYRSSARITLPKF